MNLEMGSTLCFFGLFQSGMEISDISVDIFPIYPISMIFNTISTMTDISSIYQFWTDILWKYQVCGTRVR